MTFDRRLPTALATIGAVVLAAGLGLWWVVFREVVANDYISYAQAATCIGSASDLCNLAQALCRSNHWLGITRYSSTVFWTGISALSLGLALRSVRRSA